MTGTNKFELLLFRLGGDRHAERNELFGINVFKIREIVAMPAITAVAGSPPHVLGVVNLRGQIIQVLDLPAIAGVKPKTGLNIMLVTEFARTTQAFAVESVEEIVRLVSALQATDASEVSTPEGWHPGEPVLATPPLTFDEIAAPAQDTGQGTDWYYLLGRL